MKDIYCMESYVSRDLKTFKIVSWDKELISNEQASPTEKKQFSFQHLIIYVDENFRQMVACSA